MAAPEHPLAPRFRRFVGEALAHGSPLYARLAGAVAESPDLLELAALAPREPVPNLLLTAVHDLLLRGPDDPLARFYPSLGGDAARADDVGAALRDFCARRRDEVAELVSTRRVQTNEVGRSACLLPALALAHERQGRPLALLEVGASAGLNLVLDRYGYDYGGRRAGDPRSPLRIPCEPRGDVAPPIPPSAPPIASRLGIDLFPIDLTDPDDRRWLRALVWPDHAERARRLELAVDLALAPPGPPRILAGDAIELLPGALATLASAGPDLALCVVHSSVLPQLAPDERARLDEILRAASEERPITRILAEDYELCVTTYAAGETAESRLLAEVDGHGRWMRWRA